MNDGKMVTERDAVLRERRAFDAGTRWQHARLVRLQETNPGLRNSWSLYPVENAVEANYPLPKVTRPRVVPDPHGAVWFCTSTEGFMGIHVIACDRDGRPDRLRTIAATPDRVRIWKDLLANPTEEVDG